MGVIFDKALVGTAGLLIPRTKVRPTAKETRTIDITFADDKVVGLHEETVLGKTLNRLTEAATGIDDPSGALRPKLLDHLAKTGVEHGVSIWQDEGTVEIEAEEKSGLELGHEGRSGQYAWNGCIRHEFFAL